MQNATMPCSYFIYHGLTRNLKRAVGLALCVQSPVQLKNGVEP